MTTGYSDIIYGTQAMIVTSLTRRKVPGSIKQKIGMNLVKHQIPSRQIQDWEISLNGMIYDSGTFASSRRRTLESYDDKTKRNYTDGLVTGSFIIDDLTFDDSDDNPLSYNFRCTLIEYNQ